MLRRLEIDEAYTKKIDEAVDYNQTLVFYKNMNK